MAIANYFTNYRVFWKDRNEHTVHICTCSQEVYLLLKIVLKNTDMAFIGYSRDSSTDDSEWAMTTSQMASYIHQAIARQEPMIFHEKTEFSHLLLHQIPDKLWDLVTPSS